MQSGIEDPLTLVNAQTADPETLRADGYVLLCGLALVAVELLVLFVVL